MPGKDLILDFGEYDLSRVIDDAEGIRRHNPQRHEMEQLTAVVFEDIQRGICVGYNDLKPDDFWARGHMPGAPLMPGVLMCETAAQLASYFVQKHNLMGVKMIGLGGLEDVRFRDIVRPGERLVVVAELTRVRRHAMIVCRFQEFVEQSLVCEGRIIGIPLPDSLSEEMQRAAASH